MNLPSFLWLWKIAAWSMGLSLFAYSLLAISGLTIFNRRISKRPRPTWLRPLHYTIGGILVFLVLLLLVVGIVGTLGHYGSLGHSPHMIAGLMVVLLVLVSATSGLMISRQYPIWRTIHVRTNLILFFGFCFVTVTGWIVVQKYLP
ncbi:DUF4079 domain-containing protein [Aphanothece hegewaldii CCALA 016]|uniref:DUF4079 domain-containing protein n=1 Tax=Aphanothece hegewaldii CCALA 016 TaxID=2107694 RepID=A0A2T1M2W7_9CHRO|nr:DUF4079 domain-containing protein [Aphanothece hegewaldii]PSF39098.1 DUF4079 domain-containing protein [Aphanothece hegewaldii CCALA 016]